MIEDDDEIKKHLVEFEIIEYFIFETQPVRIIKHSEVCVKCNSAIETDTCIRTLRI